MSKKLRMQFCYQLFASGAEIQKNVKKMGALVPEIISVSTIDKPLGDGYVMKYVEGESIARKILRDEKYKNALKKSVFFGVP